ncbi:filaggrin-like [Anoplophora glabripennis]|uniref:filaggrin-like n=1 Tax=Anoplophora glabripennis TaxID=217634 RepID=UPI00087391CC|nr:filaggrin-like [Anoplophora glabripennis]
MFSQSRGISHRLVLLAIVLSLHHASGRSVRPVTFGYELGTPISDVLSAVPDQVADLSGAAAEPRPVYVELVKQPLSLPLVADAAAATATVSAASDAPVNSASEKVEKVLRTPMAFSMNTDQTHAASDLKEKLQSQHTPDQQPEAIDYYKYLARLQDESKDSGAAVKKDNAELKKEESASEKKEVTEEKKDGSDLRVKSKPNIFLSHSPSHFYSDYVQPSVEFHKSDNQKSEDSKDGDHEGNANNHHYNHHHNEDQSDDLGGKGEATETHEEHNAESHQSGHQSATEEGQKEEVQASASNHGGGGDGGHDGNYKKGGGREYQSVNKGEYGQVGEKKYSGYHHHEKGEKGHKDKDDHINEYEENIGQKNGHHEEDGYEAEHQHGEEGKRATEFHEEGEHSKGHSTQGEHNIHKKDEYEKKQEFYDESHEGGEHEKHGEYFHEDDYNKGGHHKSGHHQGGAHEEHYGKQKEFEEGGHDSKDDGHQKAIGREVHHDHEQKGGEESESKGGKRWQYEQGQGHGGDDNKGAHQQQVEVVVADGTAEASDNGKPEDNKGADFHIHEITNEKKLQQPLENYNGDLVQATELHKQIIEEYNYGGANLDQGHGNGNQNVEASQHHPVLDAGHLQKGAGPAQAEKQDYVASKFGLVYGAETVPEKAVQQPDRTAENNYGADANAYIALLHAQSQPHPAHVHENGQICPGSPSDQEATAPVPQLAQPAESHGQGEASAPNNHILVVGSDGNIYGVLTNNGPVNSAV